MLHRPPALFVADALGLDFLNSIATPLDKTIDWLSNGEGLLDWLSQARLVPDSDLEDLRVEALPGELDSVAAQARSLREWFRAFVDDRRGEPLQAEDAKALEPLNRLLERDQAFRRIVPTEDRDDPLQLVSLRRWKSAESLLQPIAETLACFVCEENLALVRRCGGGHEGRKCTLLFVDHTRRGDRRWCSMAICGNRAKQRDYRDRKKANA